MPVLGISPRMRRLTVAAAAVLVVLGPAVPAAAGGPHASGGLVSKATTQGRLALTEGAVARSAAGAANLGPWRPVTSYSEPTPTSGQGLATITKSKRTATVVYRGDQSIPLRLLLQGWQHIGDPGAGGNPRGYLFDAYQAPDTATSKLYEVTTPAGLYYDFVHPLAFGEAFNNSFAAVSPDGQWMVSGEWGDMNRLLVFPTPVLNSRAPATGQQMTLNLAGTVQLNRTVRDVQGCDFVTSTQLLCSSDDPNTDLFPNPKQLLEVDLSAPLGGATTDAATVTSLGELPLQSACTGTFEVEGIDYYAPTGRMSVEVIPPSPCDINTTIYVYRHT